MYDTVVLHTRANEVMALKCFLRPVTLNGLVPTARNNDTSHLGHPTVPLMTGGAQMDAFEV